MKVRNANQWRVYNVAFDVQDGRAILVQVSVKYLSEVLNKAMTEANLVTDDIKEVSIVFAGMEV